jgi:hypothetical protein
MADPKCAVCASQLTVNRQVAVISGCVMGDECTDVYYLCSSCGEHTLMLYRDVFCGPETEHAPIHLTKEDSESRIALVRQCETPGDAHCHCEAHKIYFGGWLD